MVLNDIPSLNQTCLYIDLYKEDILFKEDNLAFINYLRISYLFYLKKQMELRHYRINQLLC